MSHDPSGPKTSTISAPWWIDVPHEYSQKITHEGLSSNEARVRLSCVGPNTLSHHRGPSLIRQFLARFKNPLVVVLLLASSVSALTGEVTNFAIISGIVLLSVTLDFVQEFRANAAADKLRQSVSVRTTVLRDGQPVDIPVREVVPGDVALLSAGSLVPADALVLEAKDLFVNQSLLTGEAYPVEKQVNWQTMPPICKKPATLSSWVLR
jgi:Mg2+-importing ATPase